jgi:hypothetical protein
VTSERFAPPKANVELDAQVNSLPRLHRVTSTALAVLLGGALPGGYMVVRNFIALKRPREAWLAGAVFVLLFAITFLVQLRSPAPFLLNQLSIGLPRLAAAVAAAWILQRRSLRAHKLAGGQFHSRWFGAVLGAGFLVVWLYVVGPLLTPLLR